MQKSLNTAHQIPPQYKLIFQCPFTPSVFTPFLGMEEKEYFEKLREYQKHPEHLPDLLEQLQRYSYVNSVILKKAISVLGESDVLEETPEPIENDNAVAIVMRQKIGQKNILSNQLWDHQNNRAKCKELSSQILHYESEIEEHRAQLRHFHEFGSLPEKEPEAEVLPDDRFLLSKKINSLRVMIAQVKKELETAYLQNDTDKVKEREKRLFELKNLKALGEKKLNVV